MNVTVLKKIFLCTFLWSTLAAQDINERLFDAIEHNQFWRMKRLLDRGASVYARQEPSGISPLIASVKAGNTRIISALIRAGASIAQVDASGKNVLHHVVLSRAFRIASLFMKPSIIDAQDSSGCTPLHIAIRRGYSFFTNLLLRHHADTNITDRRGKKPIDYACANHNTAIVSLLLKHHAYISPDEATAFLKTAVRANAARLVEQLIERGARLDYMDDGQSILFYAGNASPEIIQLLLSHHAPINTQNCLGLTPLHIAVGSCNLDFVRLLVEAGADINCAAHDRTTPLAIARDSAILKFLLDHGADVNAADDDGKTILMEASSEVTDLILQYEPSLELKDHVGMTALMHAASRHNTPIVRSLTAAGARIDAVVEATHQTPLHFVHPHRSDVARVLIEAGANPRALDDDLNIAGAPFQATTDVVVDQCLLNLAIMQAHDGGRPCIIEAGIMPHASHHQDKQMCSAWFDVDSYQGLLTSYHNRVLYEEGAAFTNPQTRRPLHRMPYAIDNIHTHLLSIFDCEQLSIDCMYERFMHDSITLEPFVVRKDEARSLVRDWLKSENKYSKLLTAHILHESRVPQDCYSMPKLVEKTKAELDK